MSSLDEGRRGSNRPDSGRSSREDNKDRRDGAREKTEDEARRKDRDRRDKEGSRGREREKGHREKDKERDRAKEGDENGRGHGLGDSRKGARVGSVGDRVPSPAGRIERRMSGAGDESLKRSPLGVKLPSMSAGTAGEAAGQAQSSPIPQGSRDKGNDEEGQVSGGEDGAKHSGFSPQLEAKKRKFSPIVWDLNGASTAAKRPAIAPSIKARLGPLPSVPPPQAPLPSSPELSRPVYSGLAATSSRQHSPAARDGSPKEKRDEFSRSPSSPQARTPTPGAVAEALEPGQLPSDFPPLNEDEGPTPAAAAAAAGIARSRWAEAQTPEHETDPPFKKSGQGGGSSAERRLPKVGSGQNLRRSRSVEEGQEGGDGDAYERDLNRRELEELEDEGEQDAEDVGYPDEEDSEDRAETPKEPPVVGRAMINMLEGCRSVDEFERLNRIDEGTYGVVYRARDKKTGEVVALKKVKMEKEREGFPMTSLREINILLSLDHPSIVDVKEVVVGNNLDSIFMVMEYMEHDLKSLMESMKQPFNQSEVKCLMLQLFRGTQYLHHNWVLHRDLKTSNLLLNNRGELKICDFGLARQYGSPLKAYTHMVVTLWYRAPELLLGSKLYSTAIDMWSLGCIMAELLAKEPLFNGKTEIDQIDKIFKLLGTPSDKIWPEFSSLPSVKNVKFVRQPYNKLREKFPATAFSGRPVLSDAGFDLLNKLLTYDPAKRITAEEALKHEWFREVPLPKDKELMPTFPTRSDHDRRKRLLRSPDPLEEQRQREKRQPPGGGGLFGL